MKKKFLILLFFTFQLAKIDGSTYTLNNPKFLKNLKLLFVATAGTFGTKFIIKKLKNLYDKRQQANLNLNQKTIIKENQNPIINNNIASEQNHSNPLFIKLSKVNDIESLSSYEESFYEELIKNSKEFVKKIMDFPTKNNLIENIVENDDQKKQRIVYQAQSTYPIMHTQIEELITNFLNYKKENGSNVEKKFYKNMNKEAFIDRLLKQRPLMFMTEEDLYILRNKAEGKLSDFESIGKESEKAPLIINDYLSYDEMQIAALIGVSVPTYFINDGNRYNSAKKGELGTYEEEGVYVGLVGARFEKPELMEWQHMMITRKQNTSKNGYGINNSSANSLLDIWSKFYNLNFPTFEEAEEDKTNRYFKFHEKSVYKGNYFDCNVYKKRIRLVIEPFLCDANKRAQNQNKKAYVHTVGLGLGVWAVAALKQAKLMLEVYADIIKENDLSCISDIDFSWFPEEIKEIDGKKDNESFITKENNKIINTIKIHFSKRNPSALLKGDDKGKLLCACYAWDGNSFPGNEYWGGHLNASGDPAAACSSTIAQLQNPYINPYVSGKYIKTFPSK